MVTSVVFIRKCRGGDAVMDLSKCVCTSDLEVLDLDHPGADMWSEVWKKPCGWEKLDRIVVDEDEADALAGQLEGMPYEGSELVMNPALPELRALCGRRADRRRRWWLSRKRSCRPKGRPMNRAAQRLIPAMLLTHTSISTTGGAMRTRSYQ